MSGSARRQYYRYYAGYTQGFVEDMLHRLDLSPDSVVADPWNGAGTTTAAAACTGYTAIGYDINPAAVIIGRARVLGPEVADSLGPLAVDIGKGARSNPVDLYDDDLLSTWFGDGTARELRALERAVNRVLVDPDYDDEDPLFDSTMPQSSLAAVFYVALFRTVRDLVRRYVPSNPSWIKNPDGRRVGATQSELHSLFIQFAKLSNPYLGQLEITTPTGEPSAIIDIAPSTELPLADASVDAVVSSPPYCTRLDYVKATLPELAILGLNEDDVRDLRDSMIGTPTMAGGVLDEPPDEWGSETTSLIKRIASHKSKASATYYKRYYMQYFAGMWDSINELHRVVKPGSSAVLVVQDSFYKDVHVDLPALVGHMSEGAGWSSWERLDFTVPRTMAAINPATRRYRDDFRAVESAVVLEG